jgi:hypothetical protein
MARSVPLNRLASELDALDYPVTREAAIDALDDVVLQYADGEERLADVLARSSADAFVTRDDLEAEVYNHLPTEAVGEPGQSEGEG